jgi:hypothetical protein
MNKSESIAGLAKALAKAQGEVENASKASVNPHFRSKYADLAEVLNTVRPVFSSNGLSFVQMPSFADGVVMVETVLMHESGEWISETASSPITKQDAQGVGSAITYLRRYSLAAFAGVAQEDDDANASIGSKTPAKAVQAPLQEAVITTEQVATVREYLTKTNMNEAEFVAQGGYQSAEQIYAKDYPKVMKILKNLAGEK